MNYYSRCRLIGAQRQKPFWVDTHEIAAYHREFEKFMSALGTYSPIYLKVFPSIFAAGISLPHTYLPRRVGGVRSRRRIVNGRIVPPANFDELYSKGYRNIAVVRPLKGAENHFRDDEGKKFNKKIINRAEYIHMLVDNVAVPYFQNTLCRLEELNNCKFVLIDKASEETDMTGIMRQVYSEYFIGKELVHELESIGGLGRIILSSTYGCFGTYGYDSGYDNPLHAYDRVNATVGFTPKSDSVLKSDGRFMDLFKAIINQYGHPKENTISPLDGKTVYISF